MSDPTTAPRWWQHQRGQIAIVVGLGLAVFVFLAAVAERHGFFDLNVYYGAIHYWAQGGEIYDFVRDRSTYGFTYPPFAALTMLPMAIVPWPVAIVISSVATIVVTWWLLGRLLDPLIRQQGWTRWFVIAVAFCAAAAFEPMRETFLFGQVNMLLLGLVAADLLLDVSRGSRWAGVGIGLATAIKLTPGIFIVYLLITKRWRAAAVASGTAAGATLLAAAVAPDASREFWTTALWDTDRIGVLSFISNQSLQGLVSRLNPAHPSKLLWAFLVVAAFAVWVIRSRRAVARGDEVAGLALTGIVGLLISPVTWVHHLVWQIPALVLVVQHGFAARAGSPRRKALLTFAVVSYVILCSRVVWLSDERFTGLARVLASNAYVWVCLALLLATPLGSPTDRGASAQSAADLRDVDVAAGRPVKGPLTIGL